MIIAIDFDGTIVEHKFPEIGTPKPYVFDVLKKWKMQGNVLILWTCRNNMDHELSGRKVLDEAINFCKDNGLIFNCINENYLNLGINPLPKIYADLYIDDKGAFAKIDWLVLDELVQEMSTNSDKYMIYKTN
jgi:hypothetical protein